MRGNLDCLHEIAQMLKLPELARPVAKVVQSVDLDMEQNWCQKLAEYQKETILCSTDDPSKQELHKLQFRRLVVLFRICLDIISMRLILILFFLL